MKVAFNFYFVLLTFVALVICAVNSEEIKEAKDIKDNGDKIKEEAKEIGLTMADFKVKLLDMEFISKGKSKGFCKLNEIIHNMKHLQQSQCPTETTQLIKKILEDLTKMHKLLEFKSKDNEDVQEELDNIENMLVEKNLNDLNKNFFEMESQTKDLYKKLEKNTDSLEDLQKTINEIIDKLNALLGKNEVKPVLEYRKNYKIKEYIQNLKDKLSNMNSENDQPSSIIKEIKDYLWKISTRLGGMAVTFGGEKYKTLYTYVERLEKQIQDKTTTPEEIVNLLKDGTIKEFREKTHALTREETVSLINKACNIYTEAGSIMSDSWRDTVKAMKRARKTEVTVGNVASLVSVILKMNEKFTRR